MNVRFWVALVMCFCLFGGCATTEVRKNPGANDKGIRYYRPKPYLLLQPFQGNSPEYVSIAIHYLPDFSEEYSIRARAGLGWNKTEVTLDQGWNLTGIKQELDSQTDENLNAVANLISKLPTAKEAPQPSQPQLVVRAKNVPFGFYESVISCGRDGVKRLYGWRYVGFMPFNQCPVVSGGVECIPCESNMLFGLGLVEGAMAFVPIDQLANANPVDRSSPVQTATDMEVLFRKDAVSLVSLKKLKVTAVDIGELRTLGTGGTYSLVIAVPGDQLDSANSDKDMLQDSLTELARKVFGNPAAQIKLDFKAKTM